MRYLLCNSTSPKYPIPIPTPTKQSQILKNSDFTPSLNYLKKALSGAIAGALSVALYLSPPYSIAFQPLSTSLNQLFPLSSSEHCREDEFEYNTESGSPEVTNEGIVEEAWEVVNESFLDAAHHRWSPETWKVFRFGTRYVLIFCLKCDSGRLNTSRYLWCL